MYCKNLRRLLFAATLSIATLIGSGCQAPWMGKWNLLDTTGDAAIHAKAKKDPFPAANEPAVESIKR